MTSTRLARSPRGLASYVARRRRPSYRSSNPPSLPPTAIVVSGPMISASDERPRKSVAIRMVRVDGSALLTHPHAWESEVSPDRGRGAQEDEKAPGQRSD